MYICINMYNYIYIRITNITTLMGITSHKPPGAFNTGTDPQSGDRKAGNKCHVSAWAGTSVVMTSK